ncbi:exo-alpha-sialidase, partial [Candidatus Latescibacterota bacterium]
MTTTTPIRIADVVGGHVHPSLAATAGGDLVTVYNREGGGGRELLLCRSSDAGATWSAPEAITAIRECSIYPGSLTRFGDGRLLLNWACYRAEPGEPWREPQFSWSEDDGYRWSTPRSYPVSERTNYTCVRNPVLELSASSWVCPFYDGTVVYDADADVITPFGDGRNHGMVPIVATPSGTIVSGAPQTEAPVPVG